MDTMPTYTRSWTEIEWMLAEAQEQMLEQKPSSIIANEYETRRAVVERLLNLLVPKVWPMY